MATYRVCYMEKAGGDEKDTYTDIMPLTYADVSKMVGKSIVWFEVWKLVWEDPKPPVEKLS